MPGRRVKTSTQPGAGGGGNRLDIQVLRAIAVGTVLIYHLWPNRLPGGFTGVDVFFVISGFLITSHLLRQAEVGGGVRVVAFWAKRARRLLPLATFVLLVTIPAVLVWMPVSIHKTALHDIIASTLYVQNWNLASGSVDYLARDNVPSVVQHYWSLSAEEQFYIVWPIIIVAATFVAARFAARGPDGTVRVVAIRRASLAALSTIFVLSFVYCVWLTATSPGPAYFATTTRAWEFAAGGLLAFLPATVNGPSARRALQLSRTTAAWTGLALIVGVCFLLPEDAAFPGVIATLPVAGACLLLWAGDTGRTFSPSALGRIRPLTYIGDVSYGIYLWHWPLVIIVPAALGVPLGTWHKIAIIAVSIMLSAASKVLIEDPFRLGSFWRTSTLRGFIPAAIGTVAVVMVSTVAIADINRTSDELAQSFVARPLSGEQRNDLSAPLAPALATRTDDHAQMYDCFDLEQKGPRTCTYGPADAKIRIAVTGDSHAAQLIPALVDVAERKGWRLDTYVGLNCDAALNAECAGGNKILDSITEKKYDLVLFSAFRGSASKSSGVTRFFTALVDADVPLLPVADTPANPRTDYDCVDSSEGDVAKAQTCLTSRKAALVEIPDRVAPLAKRYGIPFVDLTDVFCGPRTCRNIINNVVVYADSPSSHITRTFSLLLAPRLEDAIAAALRTQQKR